jgi:hypothetical protein
LRALADAVPATQKSLDAPVASHLGSPVPSPRSLGALTEGGGGDGERAAGRSAFVEFEKKVKSLGRVSFFCIVGIFFKKNDVVVCFPCRRGGC